MRNIYLLLILFIISTACSSQDSVSLKKYEPIALQNKIEFYDPKFDQPKFSCGFLLKFNNDTFAVTAKHVLKIVKPEDMKNLVFQDKVKSWSMFPLDKKEQILITGKLLNENKSESLEAKSTYENDWLVFSIKENNTQVKPLTARTTQLIRGEKLFVVGWTRKIEEGPQRVYEFEYYKTIGNRILLKDVIVPQQFGGLSGAPVVDEKGLLVGIVSNGTVDKDTDKKYFSPCNISDLMLFLSNYQMGK